MFIWRFRQVYLLINLCSFRPYLTLLLDLYHANLQLGIFLLDNLTTNFRPGSNLVGPTWNYIQCFYIWAGAQLKPGFGGSVSRFIFLKVCCKPDLTLFKYIRGSLEITFIDSHVQIFCYMSEIILLFTFLAGLEL